MTGHALDFAGSVLTVEGILGRTSLAVYSFRWSGTAMQDELATALVDLLQGPDSVRRVRVNKGIDMTPDGFACASIDVELEMLRDVNIEDGTVLTCGTHVLAELK